MSSPTRTAAPAQGSAPPRTGAGLALSLDVLAVLVFVLVGRRSHAEGATLAGTASTAWPFLLALALGWLVARAWRAPASLGTGLLVWGSTVALGQGLRLLAGQGSAVSFVVVTAIVLAAFLLGWRGVAGVRARRRPAH